MRSTSAPLCRCASSWQEAQATAVGAIVSTALERPLVNTSNPEFVECMPKTSSELLGVHDRISFRDRVELCISLLPEGSTNNAVQQGDSSDDAQRPALYVEGWEDDATGGITSQNALQGAPPPDTESLRDSHEGLLGNTQAIVVGVAIGAAGEFHPLCSFIRYMLDTGGVAVSSAILDCLGCIGAAPDQENGTEFFCTVPLHSRARQHRILHIPTSLMAQKVMSPVSYVNWHVMSSS